MGLAEVVADAAKDGGQGQGAVQGLAGSGKIAGADLGHELADVYVEGTGGLAGGLLLLDATVLDIAQTLLIHGDLPCLKDGANAWRPPRPVTTLA